MKVLHVLNTLQTGGAEYVVLNLAKKIERSRFDLAVCSVGDSGELAREFEAIGVPTFALHRRPGWDLGLPLKLASLVRRERVDMLHSHNVAPWLYGAMAAQIARVPICHTEHSNVAPHQRALAVAENALSRITKVVIADSEDVRRYLVERQGLPGHKVVTVVNGIDTELYSQPVDAAAMRQKLGLPADAFVVGTVGRLVPEKDQRSLLEAFAMVAAQVPRAHLAFAGDGVLRGDLESHAKTLGFADRVTFLGRRSDVAAVLRVFDVFVLSSVSEGLPLALLEAMAAGVPCVVTAVGGMGEAVQNEASGLVVPARQPANLAAALKRLDDPALRSRFGQAGQRRAREVFDLRLMARRYEEAYLS